MKTKAAILRETGKPLEIKEIEVPSVKRGQVLVKILYSGICHSQINEIRGLKGEDKYLPHLLGHEGSGIVESVGGGVTKVKKGDYVVLSWIKGDGKDVPSTVYACGNERINAGAISTFSTYAVIAENRMVKIPEKIPADIAALLGCAVPTGAGIIKNHIQAKGPVKGKTLAIFGVGGIGASALLYARTLPFEAVIAIDINEKKLSFASALEATSCINPRKGSAVEAIKKLTAGKGADYAVECTGVKQVMEDAFASLADTGTAIIAGNLRKGETISIDPFDLIRGKKLTGTWGGATNPDRDIPFYADLYLRGKLKLDVLVSATYSLDKVSSAIEALEKGAVVRALVRMD